MSYEGYEQILCTNGHYDTQDCHDSLTDWRCPSCGARKAWWNAVDQTNDSGTPAKLKVKYPAVMETCSVCGHVKVIEPARYYVPEEE